ncbi:MAG: type II secretion system F family protein [Candidatus Micrarchaeia archaeon]
MSKKEKTDPTEKVSSSIFARPIRKKTSQSSISNQLVAYFPEIRNKLTLAGLDTTPAGFMDKVVQSTIFLSIAGIILISILLSIFLNEPDFLRLLPLILLFVIILPVLFFWYLMLYLDVAIIRKRRNIDYEIVFLVRHMIIALRSGMPLFDVLVGVSVGYGELSREFNKIVEKTTLGVSLSQALRESANNTPSKNYARVIMQISNALSSGADVADSLEVILEQVSKDQVIALKTYGNKLTPFVMFFMIFGIILPSLGVAFAVILLSLIAGNSLSGQGAFLLSFVLLFIMLVQYLFLAMVEGSRPHYTV